MRVPTTNPAAATDIGSAMTPMIDVVFQLLIYFICTASFRITEQELPTRLPPIGSTALAPAPAVQELELLRIGLEHRGGGLEITLNGQPCRDLGSLRERLDRLARLAQLPVVLEIAPDVELGHVVAVYDTCLLLGLADIHFAAPER
jgi:biopolymer transport protein ExbD